MPETSLIIGSGGFSGSGDERDGRYDCGLRISNCGLTRRNLKTDQAFLPTLGVLLPAPLFLLFDFRIATNVLFGRCVLRSQSAIRNPK